MAITEVREDKKMEDKMKEVVLKAETLIEALPYIRDFNGKKVVVKYGGSAIDRKSTRLNSSHSV